MVQGAHKISPGSFVAATSTTAAASNDAEVVTSSTLAHRTLGVRPVPSAGPSLPADPLAALERALLAEEIASFARSGLRNRFSTIKSASYYLKRRAQKTEAWDADPRVAQFFKLVEDQVGEALEMLDAKLGFAHLLVQRLERVSVATCATLAVGNARLGGAAVVLDVAPVALVADAYEIAVAIRCMLENAAEAGATKITLHGAREGNSYFFTVEDDAGAIDDERTLSAFRPFSSTKAGHVGLGLNVALRVARRHGGALALASNPTRATLALPLPQTTPAPRARGAHGVRDPSDWDDETLQPND